MLNVYPNCYKSDFFLKLSCFVFLNGQLVKYYRFKIDYSNWF
ncbi:hypothetical protein BC643_1769 [Mangrovibacterium diazotrophicum]|uniref:Uncharacterized protein n=1 Tax=Mangrovibacterium diazotrophicum TaxID=1261403 RepID=A0A419W7J0_9BACT|nr:hypothetical protein BC643_1769 [Mangrovibacterium diazotrophicum]